MFHVCNLFICGIVRSTRHSQDLELMWQVLLMFSVSPRWQRGFAYTFRKRGRFRRRFFIPRPT